MLEGVPFEMPVVLKDAVTDLLGAPKKKTESETDEGEENSNDKNEEEEDETTEL